MSFQSRMTVGVVSDTCLLTYSYVDKHYARQEVPPLELLTDLLDLAHERNIQTIWVVPGSHLSQAAQEMYLYSAKDESLHMTVSHVSKRDSTPRFVQMWRLSGNTQSLKIGFPEHDTRWPFADCTDAKTLLYALLYLQDALECEVAWAPGHVGQDLMLSRLSNHPAWLVPPDLPDVVKQETNFAKDWRWHRQLTAHECGDGMYFHLFDKNSMYLAACTSANLGEGTPQHIKADQGTLFRNHEQWSVRIPAAWHVEGAWLWGPELDYMVAKDEQWEPHIPEAYIWPTYHQSLRWWGEHLWNARQSLHSEFPTEGCYKYNHRSARDYAYNAVKRVATQGLGWLAMDSPDNKLYRPDWWNQVVATARKNMGFKVRQLMDKGIVPCYINVDSIGLVSEGPDIERYAHTMLNRKGALGGFKHVKSVPVTPSLVAALRGSFRDAQNAVNEVES